MNFKVIAIPSPFAFYDKNGAVQASYAIVFVSTINDQILEELGINYLMQELRGYGFEKAPNTHMTVGFVARGLENLNIPYGKSDVDNYFEKARELWNQEPFLKRFSIKLSDIEYNPQAIRRAVRLTTKFKHDEIVQFKQKYIERFGLSLESDCDTTLNFGLANKLDFLTQEEQEIKKILTEFNKGFRGKVINVDRVTLVYHQNHFVVDNLREEEFLLK